MPRRDTVGARCHAPPNLKLLAHFGDRSSTVYSCKVRGRPGFAQASGDCFAGPFALLRAGARHDTLLPELLDAPG